MKFETGKYYQHVAGGEVMHILGPVNTFFHGATLLAELECGSLRPVGKDETSATGWQMVSGWPRKTYDANNISEPNMAIDVVNMRSVQERRRLLKDAIKPNNCEMCGVDKNVSLCWCIK